MQRHNALQLTLIAIMDTLLFTTGNYLQIFDFGLTNPAAAYMIIATPLSPSPSRPTPSFQTGQQTLNHGWKKSGIWEALAGKFGQLDRNLARMNTCSLQVTGNLACLLGNMLFPALLLMQTG